MADKPRVGFIGVGMMGHGMASNLVAKGFPTTILGHRNRKPVDDLVSKAYAAVIAAKLSPRAPTSC